MYSFQLMAFIRRSMKGKIITYMILWISLAHRIMCFGRVLLFSKVCFSYTKNVSLFWPFGIGDSQFCVAFEMDFCCQKLGRWLFIVVQPDNDQVICLFSTQIQIHNSLCSRNFQNVKLRLDFVVIWSYNRHSHFTWNHILGSPKMLFLSILEVLNFDF